MPARAIAEIVKPAFRPGPPSPRLLRMSVRRIPARPFCCMLLDCIRFSPPSVARAYRLPFGIATVTSHTVRMSDYNAISWPERMRLPCPPKSPQERRTPVRYGGVLS